MIKKLEINDTDYIDQIFNLEKEIFKNSAFNRTYLDTLIKGDNSFIYVYLIDSKVCGYLIVLDSIDIYEILAIATIEKYRNKVQLQKELGLEVKVINQL